MIVRCVQPPPPMEEASKVARKGKERQSKPAKIYMKNGNRSFEKRWVSVPKFVLGTPRSTYQSFVCAKTPLKELGALRSERLCTASPSDIDPLQGLTEPAV